MIISTVKQLLYEEDRSRELIEIPFSEILLSRANADTVDPQETLCFLTDMFIDNCWLDLMKTKVKLCAGIVDAMRNYCDSNGLDEYPMKKIEEGIIHLKDRNLISCRCSRDKKRYSRSTEDNTYRFSEVEVSHFIVLNNRLVELQRENMNNVKAITLNLQEQIAKGYYQYNTFCIDGYIYIEDYDDDRKCDELMETLSSFVRYPTIYSNNKTTEEWFDEYCSEYMHWYANWSGVFHQLEESHGLRVCRAFRYLFEDADVFMIDDIMKIKPEMINTHIEINI